MDAVFFQLGPLQIRHFAAWWAFGIALTALILILPAWRRRDAILPYLDSVIGAGALALVGGRLGHVLLHADYFAASPNEILTFSAGGLNWHGALIGALIGAWGMARIRKVRPNLIWVAFALGLPFLTAVGWAACGATACAYGVEVPTLAGLPAWYAAELPDVYGTVVPRVNTAALGLLLAAALLVITLLARWVTGGARAVWVGVAALGVGMALISPLRADYAPIWFNLPAAVSLDLAVALLGVVGLLLYRPRHPRPRMEP